MVPWRGTKESSNDVRFGPSCVTFPSFLPPVDLLSSNQIRYNPCLSLGRSLGQVMARTGKRLSVRTVETIAKPGYHADGDGLYLVVDKSGARRWAFIFHSAGGVGRWGWAVWA